MSNVLYFKASTNVKNLIGKDLVTDQITAVFELVKNSYDADATEVTISFKNLLSGDGTLVIKDDGSGMDLDDVQNKWMIIGTESKKYKQYSDKFKRPLNGDKGIGRFSVDRLGKALTLYTVKENTIRKIAMNFDWTEFENEYKDLRQVKIPYSFLNAKVNEQGVTLEIEHLRDSWDAKSIDRLVRNLRQFKSPFNINDNFNIIIDAPEFGIYEMKILPYNLGTISSLWVNVEIPIEDTSKIKMLVVKDGIEYNEEYKNPYDFGPVKAIIYFFNTPDKISFSSKMKTTVKDFGNIRLYRDDFRIYPYGESYNDWLDLDMRHAQGFMRTFGVRDLIGYVQITKKHNNGIDAPTNRQGIIESDHSKKLREFVTEYPVKILEKYFFEFKKAKNESFEKSRKDIQDAVVELKKVAKDIKNTSPSAARLIRQVTDIVEKGQTEQTKFLKDQQELIKVYQRVASKEVFLHRIVHEALINIDAIKSAYNSLASNIKNEKQGNLFLSLQGKLKAMEQAISSALSILLTARDTLIQKKEKEIIYIASNVKHILNIFNDKFEQDKIIVNLEVNDSINYYMDKRDLKTIMENFISNSIKSLKQINNRDRIINIKILQTDKYIIFNFKDNGIGISDHLRNRIFDHFFSTTGSFGMGLSIVDEIVKEYNGELNLVENNQSGAEFQVKLRR